MRKDELLEMVNSVNKLSLNKENATEIMIEFHAIKNKISEFFSDEPKLESRIKQIEKSEYYDYKLKLDKYLANELELEELSSAFATLKLAIRSDVYFNRL